MASAVERRMVGPHEAADLLSMNTVNRPLSQGKVQQYARLMREGKWKDTGIPIILYRHAGEAVLHDGQHRLQAIVEAGVTLPVYISVVDEPVFGVVDIQKVRSLGDVIGIKRGTRAGVGTYRAAAVALAVDRYLRGGKSAEVYRGLIPSERMALIDEHPRDAAVVVDVIERYRKAFHRYPHAGFVVGALQVYRAGGEEAVRFFHNLFMLEGGIALVAGSAMHRLYQACSERAKPPAAQFPEIARAWHNWVVSAWNRDLMGEKVSRLYSDTGWISPDEPQAQIFSGAVGG